jgi:hypothetical protein
VIPPTGDAYIAFLGFLQNDVTRLLREIAEASAVPVADRDPDSATQIETKLTQAKVETASTFKVWDSLIRSAQPFERRNASRYVGFLIDQKEAEQAQLVWSQTVNHFGLSSSYLPSQANLVVNANFDSEPLNDGFDWHYQKQAGVELQLDPTAFHAGRRSLMINFNGPGISDAGVSQFVAVQPHTTYNFSAYYKTSEQQGAGAPHFTIQDVYTRAIYYESDELINASFWKSADGEFTTGSDCKLVVLHVRRLPERSPIRGKLWIDDFHLTRKPS